MNDTSIGDEDAVAQLRRASDAGNPQASTELARRLLTGRGAAPAPQEALALLARAADAGDAEALNVQATLTAAGAWMAHSWPDALELLCAAAEHGSDNAQTQLCIIAGDQALAATARVVGGDVWRRLKASVNLEAFVQPPERRQVCQSPRVWAAQGVASPALCDFLVGLARGHLNPALMYDPNSRSASFLESRNCSDFQFDITTAGIAMLLLRIRISGLTSLPPVQMEPPQIFHYALGQEIKPHYDFFKGEGIKGYGRDGSYEGDRIATSILYLNDDFDGGELEFPKVGFRHRGAKGDLVFFANVKDGVPDKLSVHAGLPITRGEKWVLSQWIHDRPFTAIA